jgi:hypothetical protein
MQVYEYSRDACLYGSDRYGDTNVADVIVTTTTVSKGSDKSTMHRFDGIGVDLSASPDPQPKLVQSWKQRGLAYTYRFIHMQIVFDGIVEKSWEETILL